MYILAHKYTLQCICPLSQIDSRLEGMWTTVREIWTTELAESTAALRESSSTLASEVETELHAVNAAITAVQVVSYSLVTYPNLL